MFSSSTATSRRRLAVYPLVALSSILLVLLAACQSDEEQIAAAMASGKAFAEQGQHPEAVIEFRKALKLDPNLGDAHYALAESFVALRKGQEAFWELSETVRLSPSNSDARLKLGAMALVARDYQQALEQAEATIRLKPDSSAAHVLNGQALEGLGRADEAEASYLRAVELSPDQGPFLVVLAGYYERQGKRESAEPLYVKLTEIEPSFFSYTALGRFLVADESRDATATAAFNKALELAKPEERVEAYQNLARLHTAMHRPDQAIQVMEQGAEALGDDPKAKARMLRALSKLYGPAGRDGDATRVLEEAATLDHDDGNAYLLLSLDRGQNGDLVGALEAANRAQELAPSNPRTHLRAAEVMMEIGLRENQPERVEEGAQLVESILAKEPSNVDALFVKGRIALARGQGEDAAKLFRASIDARPNWAMAHFFLGSSLAAAGNTSGARAEVARALELDPTIKEARRLLVQLHAALGEFEYAIEQGRIYLSRNSDPEIRVIVAQSLARLGRKDEAERAIGVIPDDRPDAQLLIARARLYHSLGDLAKARELLLSANTKSPDNPTVLRWLLRVEDGLGKLDESGARLRAAAQAKPDDSQIAELLGTYQLRKNELSAAEKSFQRAIELDPGNIEAYRQLGSLYQSTGRIAETLETYRRAVETRPDSPQLHHFLGTLYEMDGKTDEAIRQYEAALALDANLIDTKNNLAYLLAESGANLDRALDLAQEAKAASPDSPNAADTLGWVLYRRGIPSAAVGYLREAVAGLDADAPEIALVRHHLALAYEANDQKQEAIETLEQALVDLERIQAQLRASGEKPIEPAWSGEARERLTRLKQAG